MRKGLRVIFFACYFRSCYYGDDRSSSRFMIEKIQYIIFRCFIALFTALPYGWQVGLSSILVRTFIKLRPKYRKIGMKNLDLVFPEKSHEFKEDILERHIDHLGYLIADSFRLPLITAEWMERHVEFPMKDHIASICKKGPVLMVGGHLGSFEWMPSFFAHIGSPVHYIVRPFKQPLIDAWWNQRRQLHGSRVIPRHHGMKGMIRSLNAKKNVGILFDQNLRRSQAIFVDWFGRPAATTRALPILVTRFRTPVVMVGFYRKGKDDYHLETLELNFSETLDSGGLTREEKDRYITRTCVEAFETMILKAPEQWFWFHRRWKTTPDPEIPENFYNES